MFTNQFPQTLPAPANEYSMVHTSRKYLGFDFISTSIFTLEGKFCSSFFVIPYFGACFSSWSEVQAFIDDVSRETLCEEVQHD